jgi:hypothetical protein
MNTISSTCTMRRIPIPLIPIYFLRDRNLERQNGEHAGNGSKKNMKHRLWRSSSWHQLVVWTAVNTPSYELGHGGLRHFFPQRPIKILPWLVIQKPRISRLQLYFLSVRPVANDIYVLAGHEVGRKSHPSSSLLLEQKTVMLDDAV